MDPDIFQQAWQAQSSQTRVTFRTDLLLRELQYEQKNFQSMISSRDLVEVGVALLLLPFWFYMGFTLHLPWTWYLTVPVLIWIIGFILVSRIRNPRLPDSPNEPLVTSVRTSIKQVEHQIWLLKNVFWWYLLPPGLSVLAFFLHVGWISGDWWHCLGNFLFLIGLYSFIYYINQRAVRFDLEPRRRKLQMLLWTLEEETNGRTFEDFIDQPTTKRSNVPWTLLFIIFVCAITLILISLAMGLFDVPYRGEPKSEGPAGAKLSELISEQREQKRLVSLAAMVMVDGHVKGAAADGERLKGSGIGVDLGDQWHIGGVTKSITATMIARLIESDQMHWTETIRERFPDAKIHNDWKSVTLKQLLTDTAGAPKNFPQSVLRNRPSVGPECTKARRKAVMNVLADKPVGPPGQTHEYSNVGYTIAAVMAETATGKSWEQLVEHQVFEPLGLKDAGFGPPKSPWKTLDQPRGHRVIHGRKAGMGDDADNSLIMGPSGAVHMSLNSLCIYATDQMRGERGEGKLLSDKSYQLLHTPQLQNYACGWSEKLPTYDIPCTVYWHNGSNTMWYTLLVFIPDKNMVVAVASNDGDFQSAESAAWKVVTAAANEFHTDEDAAHRQTLPTTAFPKTSPFNAIRWQGDEPEVRIGHDWFHLVSLDGIEANEILSFSQKTYQSKWQKRFAEDLVELLVRMGHQPKNSVQLVVRPIGSSTTQTLEDIKMTAENREAIRAATQP